MRNSLLLHGGVGPRPWHMEGLGGKHEPETQIWPREGRLNCRGGSSCLQPSWECQSEARGQAGIGAGQGEVTDSGGENGTLP